jgi:hypothetical protein
MKPLLPVIVISLMVLSPDLSFAGAAPMQPLRATQGAFLSDGFKTSTPVTSYPSAALIPDTLRDQGWTFSYKIPAGSGPLVSGLLSMYFAKPVQKAKEAVAIEVYLLNGSPGDSAPSTTSPTFLGSDVPQFVPQGGQIRVVLDSTSRFLVPGQTVRLLVVPVGDSAKSSSLVLTSAPFLFVFPSDYSFADQMRPLWLGAHTIDESVIFFRNKPTDMAQASLLHKPQKIEKVYSFSTGKTYAEGTDWTLGSDGKLTAPAGSTLKITDDVELHPAAALPGTRTFKLNDGRLLTSAEELWNYDRDLWITYTHDADWAGPVPALAETELPQTLAKLRAKQPLKIVVFGDSISVGACATSRSMLPPFLLPWPNLLAQALREHYQAPVTLVNRSLGGQVARWGVVNAPLLVAPEAPDLCIIGFGMNDRGGKVPTDTFHAQIVEIMKEVRAGNPNVEFILVSSARNNPDWGPQQPLLDYEADMLKMQGPGVAVADLTTIHEELLQKKPFIDMSGNNVNHPNDYLVRWYAQVIAALLVPSTP